MYSVCQEKITKILHNHNPVYHTKFIENAQKCVNCSEQPITISSVAFIPSAKAEGIYATKVKNIHIHESIWTFPFIT